MTAAWQSHVRKLAKRKWRLRYKQALLEGVRLVETALLHQAPLVRAYYAPELLSRPGGEGVLQGLRQAGVYAEAVPWKELGRVSSVETSQGIIAIMDVVEPVPKDGGDLWIVVDGVQDPGNLGTIIRSAAAAGVDRVFLLPGTVDLYNPKTLRAAMGAAFQLPIHNCLSFEDGVLPYLQRQGAHLVVADVDGEQTPHEADFTIPVALVMGNEGWGPSRRVRSRARQAVRIPMPGEAESLNVAMAATVLLYEVVRQRLLVC